MCFRFGQITSRDPNTLIPNTTPPGILTTNNLVTRLRGAPFRFQRACFIRISTCSTCSASFLFFCFFFSFFVLCFVGSVRVRVPRLKRDAAQARASAVSGRKQPHVTGNFRTHSAFGRLHRTRRAQNKPKRQPLAVPVPRIRISQQHPNLPSHSIPDPKTKQKYTVLAHRTVCTACQLEKHMGLEQGPIY